MTKTKATPKTDTLSASDRLDRIETAIGPQLGVRLADYDDEAIAVAATQESEPQPTRQLTVSERLTRLEIAAAGAGIRLYASE